MKTFFVIFFLLLINFSTISIAQSNIDKDIEVAFQNARAGIYWGLKNIPIKKARLDKSLIKDNRLIAKIKVVKELNGVKVESTGYDNTNEVTILLYRSVDSLIKDGFIKKGDLEEYQDDE